MLSCEECRRVDQMAIEQFGIPSLVLMENAGRSCAEKLLWHSAQAEIKDQAVLVLCGPGNNGGDGFVIARHLYCAGAKVKVVLLALPESYQGDARTNLDALDHLRMSVVQFDADWNNEKLLSVFGKIRRTETTWIVDALLGTGAKGDPKRPMAQAISASNKMDVRRFAVDIPTGLNGDTGAVSATTFQADITGTFIDFKPGMVVDSAERFVGLLTLVDIGMPPSVIEIVASK